MSLLNSGIVFEVDWDNDGNFDEPEEDMTSYLFTLEAKTGRDWPSQLTGKAGPGLLRGSLDNTDNRFSHFNTASPLNTAPFSLKTGRKCRVRVAGADVDPPLLAKDRFGRAAGSLGATETGQAWTNQLPAIWVIDNQQARLQLETDSTGAVLSEIAVATIDVGVDDYYAQITIPQRDGNNTIGIVYRWDDDTNYGLVVWQGQGGSTEVAHFENVAGVFTETFSTGDIEFQADTTIGVHVDGTDATIYLNGVPMATGAAYSSSSTVVGIRGNGGVGRDPRIDDFYVWAGLDHDLEGVLWTGDVSDITESVTVGPRKVAEIRAEGWLAKAAATDITPPESIGVDGLNFFGQTTGELVGKTLAKAQLLHPPGPIQRGEVTTGSVGLPNGKALGVARQFEEAEFGFLYETPEGPIGFDSRTARDSSYPLAVFSDHPVGDELGYETIDPFDWRREITNEVAAGVSGRPPSLVAVVSSTGNAAGGVPGDVSVLLPTAAQGASVGDLMVIVITPTLDHPANSQQWLTPNGWTAFNPSGELGKARIYAKTVANTDLGALRLVFEDSSTFGGAFRSSVFLISNWWGDIGTGLFVSKPYTAIDDDAVSGLNDPPVVFTPWGKESTLFVATRHGMVSLGGATVSGTTGPHGYGGQLLFSSTVVNGSVNAYDLAFEYAGKWANSDVEKPSPFTGTFRDYIYLENYVIAVRGFNGSPPPPGGVQTVVSSNLDSQDEHNAVRSHRNPANLFRSKADANTYADLVLARYSDDRPIFAIGYTATSSADHLAQAVARRVSDRITLVADTDTGLNVNDDFHIESIHHRWTNAAKLWKVTYELSPAEPINRADTVDSELGITINASVTTLRIDTNEGPQWINSFVFPNMFPFAIQIDSEVIRVLSSFSASDLTSPQIFNVERGIDGTTAAGHTAGAAIALAYPWELP